MERNGITYMGLGNPPGEKLLYIRGGGNMDGRALEAVYRSSLEAALNGFDVAYVPGPPYGVAIESAFYCAMRSSLHGFLPAGIASSSSRFLSPSLVTGGGVLSPFGPSEGYRRENVDMARSAAAAFASCMLIASMPSRSIPPSISAAIDAGKDVALLECALSSAAARNLAREGCAVVSSFSAWLRSPEYIVYPDDGGRCRYGDSFFSFLSLGKWENLSAGWKTRGKDERQK